MNIKELFDDLRTRRIELYDISEKTKISYQTVRNIKSGDVTNPGSDKLGAIADAYDYELKYIDDKPNFFRKPELVKKGDEPGISEPGIEYRSEADNLLAEYCLNIEDLKFILEKIWSIDFTAIEFISKKIRSKS